MGEVILRSLPRSDVGFMLNGVAWWKASVVGSTAHASLLRNTGIASSASYKHINFLNLAVITIQFLTFHKFNSVHLAKKGII